jgi:uncharacterized membrane protein YhhN
MRRRIILGLFVAVAVTEVMSQLFSLTELHHVVKPMLMILLGLYYFFSAGERRSNIVLMALIFSFLGDSFLLYESKNSIYFILGLGSFLIAHVFYILAFRQNRFDAVDGEQLQTVQKARMAFPVILASTGLVVILYPHLGDLRLPVVVYAGVLMFMVLNALFRFQRTSLKSFWLVFVGAVLFLLSDSILAINKFLQPVGHAGVWIMTLYLAGQFLIVEGMLKHEE